MRNVSFAKDDILSILSGLSDSLFYAENPIITFIRLEDSAFSKLEELDYPVSEIRKRRMATYIAVSLLSKPEIRYVELKQAASYIYGLMFCDVRSLSDLLDVDL